MPRLTRTGPADRRRDLRRRAVEITAPSRFPMNRGAGDDQATSMRRTGEGRRKEALLITRLGDAGHRLTWEICCTGSIADSGFKSLSACSCRFDLASLTLTHPEREQDLRRFRAA
jgi:hypothetical protein